MWQATRVMDGQASKEFNPMNKHIAETAIAANIDALVVLIRDMAERMEEAAGYLREG